MLRNPTPGELKTALGAAPDTLGGFVWRHAKSAGLYRIETIALREADLAPVVVYRSEEGTAFTRPAAEFFDGRFSPILAPHVLHLPDAVAETTAMIAESFTPTPEELRRALFSTPGSTLAIRDATPEYIDRIRERLERHMDEGKVEMVVGGDRAEREDPALRFELRKERAARGAAERARDQANMMLMSFPNSPLAGYRDAAVEAIAAERQRQIDVEGRTLEHDDQHRNGAIYRAAQAYFLQAIGFTDAARSCWPWGWGWWKPTTPARDLEKSGALALAEKDRLRRAGLTVDHADALFARVAAELGTILAKDA